jgi:hypothetical protein
MNHLYDIATGRLISSGSALITPPAGMAVVTFSDADSKNGIWNAQTLSFDLRPVSSVISAGDFEDLLTDTEYAGILTLSKTDVGAEVFVRRLTNKVTVDLSSPRMSAALNYLQVAGVLTTSRVAEILSA